MLLDCKHFASNMDYTVVVVAGIEQLDMLKQLLVAAGLGIVEYVVVGCFVLSSTQDGMLQVRRLLAAGFGMIVVENQTVQGIVVCAEVDCFLLDLTQGDMLA